MEFFHHKYKCEKCGMEFKTKEELDEHMKLHVQQPEQPNPTEQQVPSNEETSEGNASEQTQDNGDENTQNPPQNQTDQQ